MRIDENGMSFRLVEFCNQNDTFKKNFVSLFTNKTNLKNIEFTGYSETGYGKPDITITFSDESIFYIEVKTRVLTGFQENQVGSGTGYSELIKDHGQSIEDSFAYLLDNNHNIDECLVDKIIYWQEVLNLVRDFNNAELVKDIIQNVDGISSEEKLFGADEELFSNPYQLAIFNNQILRRESGKRARNWIFDTFLLPSLANLGCECVKPFPWNDSDNKPSTYVEFKYQGRLIHTQFNHTQLWNGFDSDDNYIGCYDFSFTFYRPWIVGVRTATNESQLQKMTQKAVKLWLKDINNILEGKYDYEEDGSYIGYLGQKAEVYGNPILLSNISNFLNDATDIYDELLIPALNKITGIKLKNKNYRLHDRRAIKIEYEDKILALNVYGFLNFQNDKYEDFNSFTYYRPWIVGIHRAKNKEEMILYTIQAFELWLEDNKAEMLI